MSRWIVTIPPEGAARVVGLEAAKSLVNILGRKNVKEFDCLKYQTGYENLLKDPEPNMVADFLNQSLLVQCLEFSPSHLLVISLSPITRFALSLSKKIGVKNIFWFCEDIKTAGYWKDVIQGFNYVFSIQNGEIAEVSNSLNIPQYFLPTATCFPKPSINKNYKEYDVVFVGLPSSYRIDLLESLRIHTDKIVIAGENWDKYKGDLEPFILKGNWTEVGEVQSLYARSKIGIHLSYNPPTDDDSQHFSPRVFDIVGQGMMLITEENILLEKVLPKNLYRTFRSKNDLLDTLSSALQLNENFSDEEAMLLIENDHTYRSRIMQMIDVTK